MIPRYLTVKQLAQRLQVAPKTIYAWVADTDVPHYRFGSTLRFVEQEVLQWGRQVGAARSDKEQQDGCEKTQSQRRVVRRHSIHRSDNRQAPEIAPFDWSRSHQKGG